MTKNSEVGEAQFTQAQSAALPLLAAGAKKKDAAVAAGVCPQTVSAWLQEPHFSAMLQAQRQHLAALAADRLREATAVAVTTIVQLMESSNELIRLKASTYLLDRVLLLTPGDQVFAVPTEPTDARELLAALGVNC
jgi:hypothetical protein